MPKIIRLSKLFVNLYFRQSLSVLSLICPCLFLPVYNIRPAGLLPNLLPWQDFFFCSAFCPSARNPSILPSPNSIVKTNKIISINILKFVPLHRFFQKHILTLHKAPYIALPSYLFSSRQPIFSNNKALFSKTVAPFQKNPNLIAPLSDGQNALRLSIPRCGTGRDAWRRTAPECGADSGADGKMDRKTAPCVLGLVLPQKHTAQSEKP